MTYKLKIKPDSDPWTPREWDNLGHMACWHNRYNLGDEQRRDDVNTWLRELACSLDPSLEERLLYWEEGNGWTALVNEADRIVSEKVREIDAEIAATKLGYTPGASNYRLAELEVERSKWPWYRANLMAGLKSNEKIEAAVMSVIDKHVIMLPLYIYDHGGITMNTGGYSCPWDSGQVGYIYVTRPTILKEFSAKKLTAALRKKAENILRSEVETYAQYLEGDVYGYIIYEVSDDDPCDCDPFDDCDCCKDAEVVDSCWGFYGRDVVLEEGTGSLRFYDNKDKE